MTRRRSDPPAPPAWEVADWRGAEPWTLEGWLDVEAFVRRLRATPVDDWDLRDRAVGIDLGGGELQVLGFRMEKPETQVALYLANKHPGQGYRWYVGKLFILERYEDLRGAGLIIDEDGRCGISHALLHALAVLPFRERFTDVDGQEAWRYALDDVVAEAERYEDGQPDDDTEEPGGAP